MPKLLLLTLILLITASPALALNWPTAPGPGSLKLDPQTSTFTLTQMIEYFYRWAIVLGGLAAFVMLLYAGFQYLTSAGDPTKTKDARDRIGSAIGGLVLLLSSFIILNIINPELTTLRTPELTKTDEKKGKQVDCTKDEDKDKPECKLFPAGSCARVEIYPQANYRGEALVTNVKVKRETGESEPTNLTTTLPQKNGSVKFFSYVNDEIKDGSYVTDETTDGGFCLINLYWKSGCVEDSLHNQILFASSNLGASPRAFNTSCVKVIKP